MVVQVIIFSIQSEYFTLIWLCKWLYFPYNLNTVFFLLASFQKWYSVLQDTCVIPLLQSLWRVNLCWSWLYAGHLPVRAQIFSHACKIFCCMKFQMLHRCSFLFLFTLVSVSVSKDKCSAHSWASPVFSFLWYFILVSILFLETGCCLNIKLSKPPPPVQVVHISSRQLECTGHLSSNKLYAHWKEK